MAILFAGVAVTASAGAKVAPAYHLTLQNHKFVPATLKVPANTEFKVLVTNRNPTPSEFESTDFNREKIVLPDSTIAVFIGPLDKGTYKFFDDFDHATTGVLIVE
ncbi:MAG: cupredoxin domain-containing protein [Rhodanobacteraceae bacterium]